MNPKRVKIKVCGITNLEDAQLAVDLGVDYLGFNFYPESPRYILPQKALEIIKSLPSSIKKVGVFVNERLERIKEIKEECSLDLIQIHGGESLDFCKELKERMNSHLIKALRIKGEKDKKVIKEYCPIIDFLLLDGYQKGLFGGTGRTFPWEIAKEIKEFGIPFFLSGGLNPENVQEAIQEVKPFGVDTASGIEEKPGKKSRTKMREFVENAKSLFTTKTQRHRE